MEAGANANFPLLSLSSVLSVSLLLLLLPEGGDAVSHKVAA